MISLLLGMMLASDAAPAQPIVQPAAVTAPAPASAVPAGKADPNTVKCKTKPKLGSRLQSVKVCMTLAEWNNTRHDNEQFQRDITSGEAYSPNGR